MFSIVTQGLGWLAVRRAAVIAHGEPIKPSYSADRRYHWIEINEFHPDDSAGGKNVFFRDHRLTGRQAVEEAPRLNINWSARSAGGGQVLRLSENSWRLEIPAGPAENYRLAQLDDTTGLSRGRFEHGERFELTLRARASSSGDIPGTWGFGFWNDPFGLGLGQGGGLRLPELPNAAWFFHASEANYLSLRDNRPASGFLAQVFHSPPAWPFLPLAPGLVLLGWPAAARALRRLGRAFVREDGTRLSPDVAEWHRYRIACAAGRTRFEVDGQMLIETAIVPRGRLGLVVWIDNQYAAFKPDGKIGVGTQANLCPAWIEVAFDDE